MTTTAPDRAAAPRPPSAALSPAAWAGLAAAFVTLALLITSPILDGDFLSDGHGRQLARHQRFAADGRASRVEQ